MNEIIKVLMERDGMSEKEATDVFNDLQDQFNEFLADGDTESAHEILYDIGLEPDYLMELIGY